jgi:hypothetical protein
MITTPEIWRVLVGAIKSKQEAPPWLREAGNLSLEAVSCLPPLDSTTDGQHALPSVEQKLVSPDYLDFLREQIALNARGPEWLELLVSRLAAIEPFVGKELLVATFYFKPHSATLRIHPETRAVIHVEII